MSLSVKCSDFLHDRCEDLACTCEHHAEDAVRTALGDYASRVYGIDPHYALDLLAHLTTVYRAPDVPLFVPLEIAADAVRKALDVGWRPTFAQLQRDKASGRLAAPAPSGTEEDRDGD